VRRDTALRPLSRDHHKALYVAQRLRRADEGDVQAVADEFLTFWKEHGSRHFRIEEEVLLPAYARFADVSNDAVVRVLVEHVEIRRRADELEEAERETSRLRELGSLMEGHVRHEERVLFPMIEEALPEDALAELAARVEAAEAA
jgi:hemerythrin-like domain-containing protein